MTMGQQSSSGICKPEILFLIGILSVLLIIFLARADIDFSDSNPNNKTITSNTTVIFNVSINMTNLNSTIWNWNGTNYTIMNDSLFLFVNMDNVSALGENDSIVIDLSSFKNNGTVNGTKTGILVNTTDCVYGNCYTFDGKDDIINLSNSPTTDKDSNFSVSAWFKFVGPAGGYANIVGRWDCISGINNRSWVLEKQNDEKLGFMVTGSGSKATGNITKSISNVNNQWHHAVGVWNSKNLTLYFDGKYESSANHTGLSKSNRSSTAIGGLAGGGYCDFWNGSIDEVRIWNRSLSADEVYILYASNLNKYNVNNWTLIVNQSLNSTTGLPDGRYTYQTYTVNHTGTFNKTDNRVVYISTCNYTANTDWNVYFPQVCNSKDVNLGTGNLIINGEGYLYLINKTNVTAKRITLNTTGDQIIIGSGCELKSR